MFVEQGRPMVGAVGAQEGQGIVEEKLWSQVAQVWALALPRLGALLRNSELTHDKSLQDARQVALCSMGAGYRHCNIHPSGFRVASPSQTFLCPRITGGSC